MSGEGRGPGRGPRGGRSRSPDPAGSPVLLPVYRPGAGQLPPSLRAVPREQLGFHYTEPELADRIVSSNQHLPTRLGPSRHGIFVTRQGPDVADAATLVDRLFMGRLDAAPKLWAVIVYRTTPTAPVGLPVVPDPTLAPGWGHYHPCASSGLAWVGDFLLAWGVAGPPESGTTWMWAEP